MKKYYFLLLPILCSGLALQAQEVNWRSLKPDHKHLVSVKTALDFGMVYGVAYGHKLHSKAPIILGTEMSAPFGNNAFDDWKIRVNGQTELWHNNRFSLGIKPGISLVRYESTAARLYSISADIAATFGYLRPNWGLAGEANYGKSLRTHLQHGFLKDNYPEIRDGWYGSTGGFFRFGLNANYGAGDWRFFLKIGKVYGQNFKHNPTLPFYLDVVVLKCF